MFNYSFREDEALLHNAKIKLDESEDIAELYLTNLFITVIKTSKTDESIKEAFPYSVTEIKYYNGAPQIRRNGLHFDIFFLNTVISFSFFDKKDAKIFMNQTLTLLTGKTAAQRNVDSFNGLIGFIDETLDIDTTSTVKEAAKAVKDKGIIGLFGVKAVARNKGANKNDNLLENKEAENPTKPEKNDDFELQYNRLKKLKELYDAEILTKEEYEQKKKELLGEE